jgi:hypothetical protein
VRREGMVSSNKASKTTILFRARVRNFRSI